jgi:hypothetical protein
MIHKTPAMPNKIGAEFKAESRAEFSFSHIVRTGPPVQQPRRTVFGTRMICCPSCTVDETTIELCLSNGNYDDAYLHS